METQVVQLPLTLSSLRKLRGGWRESPCPVEGLRPLGGGAHRALGFWGGGGGCVCVELERVNRTACVFPPSTLRARHCHRVTARGWDAGPAHAAACMQTPPAPPARPRSCGGVAGTPGPPRQRTAQGERRVPTPGPVGLSLTEIRQLLGFLFLNRALVYFNFFFYFILFFRASALVSL